MVFKSHIGVLAFPFGTHAAPLLAIVRQLAAAAPDTLFSFFNCAPSNNSSTLPENIQAYDFWDGTPEDFSGSHLEAIALFLKASPANFEKAMEEAESQSGLTMSCLIIDAFLSFASDMAEKRGVPWVAFWVGNSAALSAHMYTDEIQKSLESAGLEKEKKEQTMSFIPGLSAAHCTDLPPEVFVKKNPTPLALTMYKMVQKLPTSKAIILNSFEEIDPIITKNLKSKFNNFLNVGPSFLSSPISTPEDTHDCLSWLQSHKTPKSVIYISFGSVIVPPPNEIMELAETLESVKFPFLWSIKDHARKNLPQGFEERTREFGKIVPWAPQLQILQHNCVGVFVTHCGWNSVLESISGGVPMIGRPFFGDHMINGRMVDDVWKIGVRVEGGVFSKNDTIKLLNYLMVSEGGGEVVRENVCKMREKAANAVGLKGSSSKNFEKLLEVIGI